MSRIDSTERVPFEIPYSAPLKMKAGDLLSARHVLIRVRLASGDEGIAEAPERPMFYGETVESIDAAVGRMIAPRIAVLEHIAGMPSAPLSKESAPTTRPGARDDG